MAPPVRSREEHSMNKGIHWLLVAALLVAALLLLSSLPETMAGDSGLRKKVNGALAPQVTDNADPFYLRQKPRLQAKVSIVAVNPRLIYVLSELNAATGLKLTLED